MDYMRLLGLGLIAVPTLAVADVVTCESRESRRVECDMNTRGEVRLMRQLSKTTCIEGRNWGLNRSSIWVEGGCRGVFASGADLDDQGYEGASAYGGAPVDAASPNQVTCESIEGRRVECGMNTRGVVLVIRQLSRTKCVENTNWGLNRSSIWVSGGCRGVFALEGAQGARTPNPYGDDQRNADAQERSEDAQYQSSGSAPTKAIDACNEYAGQSRDGILVSENVLRPGNWEIVLRFDTDRFVCNVTSGGKVTSFEEIR